MLLEIPRKPPPMATPAVSPPKALADALVRGVSSAIGVNRPTRRLEDSPEFHSKLVGLVNQRYREGTQAQYPWREQWALNEAFMRDKQDSVYWSTTLRRVGFRNALSPRGRDRIRNRTQFNIYKRRISDEASQFLGARPRIRVRSNAYEQQAIEAAQHAEKVVGEHLWDVQQMDHVMGRAIPLLCLLGTVYLKVEYLPDEGRVVGQAPVYELDPSGEPIIEGIGPDGTPQFAVKRDETGQPQMRDVHEGRHVTTPVDPEDLIVDPTCRDHVQNAMWVIHGSWRDPAWVYQKFKKRVSPHRQDRDGTYVMHRSEHFDGRPHGVHVKELWIRKGTYTFDGPQGPDEIDFPNGYVVITADDKVLWQGPNPYQHGKLPFIHIPKITVRGELLGDTDANSLREPQQNLNTDMGQWNDAKALTGNPMMICPSQHKLTDSMLGNRAGRIWEFQYIPGVPLPQFHQGVGPSPDTPSKVQLDLQLINEISGQHTGGMAGGVPPNVEAGVAFEAIDARDKGRRVGTALELGRAYKEWAEFQLDIIRQFWTMDRHVAVGGRFNTTRVISFSNADLPTQLRVGVVPDSVLPQSRAAKMQKGLTLYQMQLLSRSDVLHRLGEDESEDMSLIALQVAFCQEQISKAIMSGQIDPDPAVLMQMDHALCVEEYQRFLFDATNKEKYPQAYEAVKMLVQAHNNAAKIQQLQAMEEQMRIMAEMNAIQQFGTEGAKAVFQSRLDDDEREHEDQSSSAKGESDKESQ